jgi:hypothetical protein
MVALSATTQATGWIWEAAARTAGMEVRRLPATDRADLIWAVRWLD